MELIRLIVSLLALAGVAWWPALVAAGQPTVLRAGAAAVDVSPPVGVSLDGPISKSGPAKGVHDPLHARALVLDDGTTRIAIVVVDACMIGREVVDAAKAIVTRRTGLPPERMLIAATHTHAAPRAIHVGTGPLDDAYHVQLAKGIADAIVTAEGNLAPAAVGWGEFTKPEFLACRRHLCEPGSVAASPFGATDERIKSVAGSSTAVLEPAGPVDPEFSILSVRHPDGRPLALLGNFSVHYCGGYAGGLVSADYFGHFAEALEAKLDAGDGRPPFVGIMSNGTSGNTGGVLGGGKDREPFEWMAVSARILATETLDVLATIEHRRDHMLAMQHSELKLGVRRPDAERIAWAKSVLADPNGRHPHKWSPIYAREALDLSRGPAEVTIPMQAIRIGGFGIAAIPCEVFAETGLAIKRQSPHGKTFTMELANAYGGYLPTPEQHALGGYETWPARSSFLEVEAETRVRAEALRLLQAVTPKDGD